MKKTLTAGVAVIMLAAFPAAAQTYNLTLSGASPGGLWSRIGGGIDAAIAKAYPGSTVTYQTSSGGLANIPLVSRGKVPMGLATDGELNAAVKGAKPFKKAIDNVAPILEVKSKRIGGATYQVPIEISESRRIALAMRWIIGYAQARKGQTMADRLAAELIAAANNDGSSVKKKEDTHRMAEANKAFAHFR